MPVKKHAFLTAAFLQTETDVELWRKIEALLQELLSAGPAEKYCGSSPPAKSYDIPKAELWAFAWNSTLMLTTTYLKFVIDGDTFLLVDCHESTSQN